MKLDMDVGVGPGHIVLDGGSSSPHRGTTPPQFSAHVCYGQTAGWIKMPLGTEVGLGPGDIVIDEDPALQKRDTTAFRFSAHNVYCGQAVAHLTRVVVSVSTSRSRDCLETYQRLVSPKIVNVSVSSRSRPLTSRSRDQFSAKFCRSQ